MEIKHGPDSEKAKDLISKKRKNPLEQWSKQDLEKFKSFCNLETLEEVVVEFRNGIPCLSLTLNPENKETILTLAEKILGKRVDTRFGKYLKQFGIIEINNLYSSGFLEHDTLSNDRSEQGFHRDEILSKSNFFGIYHPELYSKLQRDIPTEIVKITDVWPILLSKLKERFEQANAYENKPFFKSMLQSFFKDGSFPQKTINEFTGEEIKGLTKNEAILFDYLDRTGYTDDLLEEISKEMGAEGKVYSHKWKPKQVIFINNTDYLHQRGGYDGPIYQVQKMQKLNRFNFKENEKLKG